MSRFVLLLLLFYCVGNWTQADAGKRANSGSALKFTNFNAECRIVKVWWSSCCFDEGLDWSHHGSFHLASYDTIAFTFGFSTTGLAVGGKNNSLPNLGWGKVKLSSFYKCTEVFQLSRRNSSSNWTPLQVETAMRSTPVSQWQKQPCAAVELCQPCSHDHASASFFNPGHFFLIANFFFFFFF